eukprot:Ihof_evm4s185 gene=Ihof_evmTU4s185
MAPGRLFQDDAQSVDWTQDGKDPKSRTTETLDSMPSYDSSLDTIHGTVSSQEGEKGTTEGKSSSTDGVVIAVKLFHGMRNLRYGGHPSRRLLAHEVEPQIIESMGLDYIKPEDRPREDTLHDINEKLLLAYKNGHIETKEYESEQPIYEVGVRVDRYGWIGKDAINLKRTQGEQILIHKQTEREMKWRKMDQAWTTFYTPKGPTAKLRDRTYKGMPDSYRATMWKRFLHINPPKTEESMGPAAGGKGSVCGLPDDESDSAYMKIVGIYNKLKEHLVECSSLHQIDLDVNRTLRDHIMFRDRHCIKQQQLFYVLGCYSLYRPDVGYVQGMSGIAAFLLMFMNEEQAFMGLDRLFTSPKYELKNLYAEGFPRLIEMYDIFRVMLRVKLPDLWKLFESPRDFPVDERVYSTKWFLQIFQDRLPNYSVLRMWDIFLMEGYRTVPCAALAIMQMHKARLFQIDADPNEEIMDYLQYGLQDESTNTDALLR